MLYRNIASYLKKYYADSRNALLITGARQIGKTYSIREFGKTFKSFVEINFIETPDAMRLADAHNADELMLRISALTSSPLIPGETLIFFDEVQVCPEIVTAIKFLVDEGSYRYILSGSLLGVELNDLRSQPVGYMGVKEMYPLDLREFMVNLGVSERILTSVEEAYRQRRPVDSMVHDRLMQIFRLYTVVGGMPAAVNAYIESNNMRKVLTVQEDIVVMYRRDIAQYSVANEKLTIKEIFDLIPSELDAKNKRFILNKLQKSAKYERFRNSFLWLADAGVAIPVYNVEEPKMPLKLSVNRSLFKLFSNDVGLLCSQYADGVQLKLLSGDSSVNFGSVYENFVAQELIAHNITPYYYNNKKQGEIDFVIPFEGAVLPIEVKSGKDYIRHSALTNLMGNDQYGIKESVVLCMGNVEVAEGICYFPIYMTMCIVPKNFVPEKYVVDLSGLK